MSEKPISLHQFTPALGYGDAISNNVVTLMKLFQDWGYEAKIYTAHADPRVAHHCQPYQSYKPSKKDILIYHYGSASEITPFLLKWPSQLAIIYHNITPHRFFEFNDPKIYHILKQGREDLKRLSVAPFAIGVSNYNCQELRNNGFCNVRAIPILLNFNIFDKFVGTEAELKVSKQLDDGYLNILFLGRLVPNKRQDDLIRLLAYYKTFINKRVRLLLIGSEDYRFKAMLEILAKKLGVVDDVHFLSHLALEDGFTGYYKGSTVFVSMSEHEGFGIPLLESMYFDLPVIAYASSAIPEIMGDAGILVQEKRYDVFAELIHLVATDDTLRQKIITKQRERLRAFDRHQIETQLRDWVTDMESTFTT